MSSGIDRAAASRMALDVEAHTGSEREALRAKFAAYRARPDRKLRNELIEAHRQLAVHFANKYANRGEPFDDLAQVAQLGILKAVERFDPAREIEFSTYAGATVEGELKRHFRDRTWSVRVPRRLQELHLKIRPTTERLAHSLGRSPSVGELAVALDASEEEILQAMEAGGAYRSTSLDAPKGERGDSSNTERFLGTVDTNFAKGEYRIVVDELLAQLPERERMIVAMRFFDELSQSEIAERVGVSQMHVSRLLARTLTELRALLTDEVAM